MAALAVLTTCVPLGDVTSPADVQFDLGVTGPLRVPVAGQVTPAVTVWLDGSALEGAQYRLESLNPEVASVDRDGRVLTGLRRDTASVRVVYVGGVTGATPPDTVVPIRVVVSEVVVDSPVDTLTWGQAVQLDARGLDAQGAEVPGLSYRWTSSDEEVVTVDASGAATGVGGAIGTAVLTAEVDDVEGSDTVTVFVVIGSVRVFPLADDTLHFLGDDARFGAMARDTLGVPLQEARFTWTSDDEAVATVDSVGLVTATGPGTTLIRAEVAGEPGTAEVVVYQVATAVDIWPETVTLAGNGDTYTLSASSIDSGGAPIAGRSAVWSSADPGVVEVDANGRLTARVGTGQTAVSAEVDGLADTAEVTVVTVAAVELEAATPVLAGVDDATQLTAVARDAGGALVPNVRFRWASDDPDVASVSSSGVVTGLRRNVATITATAGTATASVELSVGWRSVHPNALGYSLRPDGTPDADRPETNTCALDQRGAVYCWGNNTWGQFGNDTTAYRVTRPVPAAGGLRFDSLTASGAHTCGLTAGGVVYCWGANEWGQLGDGTTERRLTPVPVAADGMTFRMVNAGRDHTCAIAADGAVYCWGANYRGQIGDGSTVNRTQPQRVAIDSLQMVDASGFASCGLDGAGTLYCWGWFEVHDTTFGAMPAEPGFQTFPFTSIAVAYYSGYCGVTEAGLVRCLSDALTHRGYFEGFQLLPGGDPVNEVRQISAGSLRFCTVTQDHSAYCWDWTEEYVERVEGNYQWESVSSGRSHACGITTGGRLYCWGNNAYGQLGDGNSGGDLEWESEPTPVLRP